MQNSPHTVPHLCRTHLTLCLTCAELTSHCDSPVQNSPHTVTHLCRTHLTLCLTCAELTSHCASPVQNSPTLCLTCAELAPHCASPVQNLPHTVPHLCRTCLTLCLTCAELTSHCASPVQNSPTLCLTCAALASLCLTCAEITSLCLTCAELTSHCASPVQNLPHTVPHLCRTRPRCCAHTRTAAARGCAAHSDPCYSPCCPRTARSRLQQKHTISTSENTFPIFLSMDPERLFPKRFSHCGVLGMISSRVGVNDSFTQFVSMHLYILQRISFKKAACGAGGMAV